MKNLIKLFGIIALVAAIGLTAVSCDNSSPGPGGGNNPGGGNIPGTFTLTGIPAEYNGKYAGIGGMSGDNIFAGYQSIDPLILPQISGGRVSIPMWVGSVSAQGYVRYYGNDTRATVIVYIYNTSSSTDNEILTKPFGSVTFSNGSATRAW